VGLRWVRQWLGQWVGHDEAGAQVALVAETVSEGGQRRYWFAWRQDGSPQGVTVGQFPTAEEAMAAVDRAGGSP
jgi:hypothetical protein